MKYSEEIDCLVLGYYERPIKNLLKELKPTQNKSGSYDYFYNSSATVAGERRSFLDMLKLLSPGNVGKEVGHLFDLPHLGACYLTSFLQKNSLTTKMINSIIYNEGQLKDHLNMSPKLVVVTTTFIFDEETAKELVQKIRSSNDKVKIVLGGPYIYSMCKGYSENIQDQLCTYIGADFYINDSQGESTLVALCKEIKGKSYKYAAIPNLLYFSNNNLLRTKRIPENNNINDNAILWENMDSNLVSPMCQMYTSRSCPFRCAFCLYPTMGDKFVMKDLSVIEKELDYLSSLGTEYIMFLDDTINAVKDRLKKICRIMIKKRYKFKWFAQLRCSNADTEDFDLMQEAGCQGVVLGIESANSNILKNMNKDVILEKYYLAIKQLNLRDVITHASFVVGFPGETEQSYNDSINFIKETQVTSFGLEPFFYSKLAPIAKTANRYGLVGNAYSWRHNTMDWEKAFELARKGSKDIKDSIWLPSPSGNLSAVAYLMSRGFSKKETLYLLSRASQIVKNQSNNLAA